MDVFQELRELIEEADSRDDAVDLLVSRMGMSEAQASDVLDTPFTKELREAMYPEGWLSFLS